MSATAVPHPEFAMPKAGTLTGAPMHGATARLGRAAGVAGEVLLAVAVVMCIPFVILAIGIPVALFVRLLLWIVGLL